ncbi:PREDICTED: probable serine/threonine-protein kinase roco4 [Amphimedon queenslandica]|uniref:COR domain-containing protein n=1 Tax=Amphimedon queenslandica TaxID=400682 RepID=A0AAN0JKZ2_AMPQE|nr:PREDICTED: probable serine/threonine-protein kinase roco4 [Amphimedon queenslandica]|eukprot:XP_019857372.1 PREDICTED: probable serine/threonine-protein kinase roco4 [Amphimedon queenslandica]
MLLGSAGTGKTSLKHSLMEEPFNPHTTSTIVSDVLSVRPFGHEWKTMRENKWRETSAEDEIEELAHLFKSFQSGSSSHHKSMSTQYSYDKLIPTSAITSILGIESSFIQSILRRATHSELSLMSTSTVQPFLHIWDCGGQPVFLEILPAFLTPRTMFLLLFDASKDFRERWQSRQNTPAGEVLFGEVVNESTSDLMAKWMSIIHSHLMKHNKDDTSSPSLYCIGTLGDKLLLESKKKAKEQIQSLYGEKEFSDVIKDVLIIDNTTSGKGEEEDPSIKELRKAIDGFINKLVVPTPVNWVLFRKVYQELGLNVISLSDAIAIGVACHIPAADVPEVLKFYHELGALLYYPKIEGLKNKVILSPKWFVDTIGKLFPLERGWSKEDRWLLFQSKGILVEPLYQEVWQSSGIDPEEIIELLVHFCLAASVQTKLSRFKQYFLPAVLPGYTGDPNEVQPGYKLRTSPAHITFSTGYVPPGFFTRLATTVTTNPNVELSFDSNFAAPVIHSQSKSIYHNRVYFSFSYGRPSDNFVLTDINEAIQVDVLRYVPESSHSVPFKTVCQQIMKLLDACCQQVEDTLSHYHGHHADRSSRKTLMLRSRHALSLFTAKWKVILAA